MPVRCLATSKTIREAERGELIGLSNEDGTIDWAIVTNHHDNSTTSLACIKTAQEDYPSPVAINYDSNEPCLSWGSDWIFEPMITQGPFSRALRDRAGSWVIQDAEVGLRLGRDQLAGTQAYTLSLTTFEPMMVARNHAVGGRSWRLWVSLDEMADPKKKPILEINANRIAEEMAGQEAR